MKMKMFLVSLLCAALLAILCPFSAYASEEGGEGGGTTDPTTPGIVDPANPGIVENETVRVTFVVEGTAVAPEPQEFARGGKAVKPEDPVRANDLTFSSGYLFVRWNGPDGEEYDFDSPVYHDITLTAQWKTDIDTFAEKFGGYIFYRGATQEQLDIYYETREWRGNRETFITDFDCLEGLSYDPETHTLTLENYTGPILEICNRIYETPERRCFTVEIKGENHVYDTRVTSLQLFHADYFNELRFIGDGTLYYDRLGPVKEISSNADGSLDYQRMIREICFFERDGGMEIIWDGPSLYLTQMVREVKGRVAKEDQGLSFTLLSGAIDIEITPCVDLLEVGGKGAILIANNINLYGGSCHLHYVYDEDVVNYLKSVIYDEYVLPSGGKISHPFFDGFYTGTLVAFEGLLKEPFISSKCDFQLTLDPKLAAEGISVVPFVQEVFEFSLLNPELTVDMKLTVEPPVPMKIPVADVNTIPGLSFDYEHYIDLDNNYTLVMDGYDGPGLYFGSKYRENSTLILEVHGENVIHANAASGLWMDDVNLVLRGDGTLRIIAPEPGGYYIYSGYEEGDVRSPDQGLVCNYAIIGEKNGLYDCQDLGDSNLTMDGPTVIMEGVYHNWPLDIGTVTIKSGSLNFDSYHFPISKTGAHDKYHPMVYIVSGYQQSGGVVAINYGKMFPLTVEDNLYRCFFQSSVYYLDVTGGKLLLVGESALIEHICTMPRYYAEGFIAYQGEIITVKTDPTEHGEIRAFSAGYDITVNVTPAEGYVPDKITYSVDGGEPVEILRVNGRYGFIFPENATSVTVNATFIPKENVPGPEITAQPADTSAEVGAVAEFAVAVKGKAPLTYQWQFRSNASDTWKASAQSGNKTATLSVAATAGLNGYQFRCLVTDENGKTAATAAATLTVKPKITTQPTDTSAEVGARAEFAVAVKGKAPLTYQWQFRSNASDEWKASGQNGNKTAKLSVAATAGLNGYQFRCLVTDKNGQTTASAAATLTVRPGITIQPADTSAEVGARAEFTVAAKGKAPITYQWQFRSNASDEWKASGQSGNKTAKLSVAATAGLNGYQFRCLVTDKNGQTTATAAATLTVKPKITTQPADTSAEIGSKAEFTVAVKGKAPFTYQWQFRSNASDTWKASAQSGNKTAKLSVTATGGLNGYQFRCLVTDKNGQTTATAAATLTVKPKITAQPSSVSVTAGTKAKFTVAVKGKGTLSYQWQYRSSASGTWYNSNQEGNKTETLTVAARASLNGYQFRCLVTDENGQTVSSAAVLTITAQ